METKMKEIAEKQTIENESVAKFEPKMENRFEEMRMRIDRLKNTIIEIEKRSIQNNTEVLQNCMDKIDQISDSKTQEVE